MLNKAIGQSRGTEMARPSSKRIRSIAGLLLAIALLPALLAVLACLPTPIGDPEQARVDPAMSGAWLVRQEDGIGLLILEPFDKRCYLATWIELDWKSPPKEGDPPPEPVKAEDLGSDKLEAGGIMITKAWLTSLGGETLMCWEPKLVLDEERGMRPGFWYGWKVDFDGEDQLVLSLIDPDHAALKDLDEDTATRQQVEELIGKHVNDPKLYVDKLTCERIPPSRYGQIESILDESGFSAN
jgi:hypothetical protein